MFEQTPDTIRAATNALDRALQRADIEAVVACFSEDCVIELLGVSLFGHELTRNGHRV
jgi:ketosteroid isomerase-like protein